MNTRYNAALIVLLLWAVGSQAQTFTPSRFAGTWMGSWINQTFNSNGPAKLVVTVNPADSTMLLMLDLDGFVGGMLDPPAWFATGKYDNTGMRLDSVATEGTLSLRWKSNDSVMWSFTNMTSPGFSSQTGAGMSTADSISLDYTVFFSPAGSATGITKLTKVSTTSAQDPTMGLPSGYALYDNYPNPFNPSTNIRFLTPDNDRVRITVHALSGEIVAVLTDGRFEAGMHSVVFDGTGLSTGVYFYRMATPTFSATRKMAFVK